MEGIYGAIASAFSTMVPYALFIALCERAVGMLVRAFSGSRRGLI